MYFFSYTLKSKNLFNSLANPSKSGNTTESVKPMEVNEIIKPIPKKKKDVDESLIIDDSKRDRKKIDYNNIRQIYYVSYYNFNIF